MPPRTKSKPRYPDMTTIWAKKSTVQLIREVGHMGETPDEVISRILSSLGRVFVEILSVNGESPQKYTVLIKVGEVYHLWNGREFIEIDRNKVRTVIAGLEAKSGNS